MRKLFFCLLFFPTWLNAQSPVDTTTSDTITKNSGLPWFSIIVATFVVLVLFSGILVQKRWKDK